jgi:hypothetical protein
MYCEQVKEKRRLLTMYRTRLASLYAMKINQMGEFSLSHPILHGCNQHGSEPFTWFSTVSEMLNGRGCPRCGPVAIKAIEPIAISGKQFTLRTKLEGKMLKALKQTGYKASDIATRLEFPIPITFGKHSPALYVKEIETVYDVFKSTAILEKRLRKVILSRDTLATYGLRYRIAVIVNGKIEFRNTTDLVAKKERKTKTVMPTKTVTARIGIPRSVLEKTAQDSRKALAERKQEEARRRLAKEDEIEYARLAKLIQSEHDWNIYVKAVKRQAENSPREQRQLKRIENLIQKQKELPPPF